MTGIGENVGMAVGAGVGKTTLISPFKTSGFNTRNELTTKTREETRTGVGSCGRRKWMRKNNLIETGLSRFSKSLYNHEEMSMYFLLLMHEN